MTPVRIASLLASATETLHALGLGAQVVAVSHECDHPPDVLSKPRITRSRVDPTAPSAAIDTAVRDASDARSSLYEIDADLLESLNPELIVTQSHCQVCAVHPDDLLRVIRDRPKLRNVRWVALNTNSLADLYADIRAVAAAAGVAERGLSLTRALENRIETLRERTTRIAPGERPRVVVIEWIAPLMIAANWMPELIDIAGGTCPLTRPGEHSRYGEWNDVVKLDPQVIVVAPCGFDVPRTLQEAHLLRSWPGWDNLSAVRRDRVFIVDGNAYCHRSGPRLVETAELLAHLFHPQRFPRPEWMTESVATRL